MEPKKNVNIFELWENKVSPLTRRLKKYFYIPLILGALAFLYIYLGEMKKKPSFTAKITFMLEDDILNDAQKIGAGNQLLMALSGQSAQSNKAIMVDLGVSNKLVETTLLSVTRIDGKDVVLVNYFMEKFGYKEQWKKEGNQKMSKYSFAENYAIGTDSDLDFWLRFFSNEIKVSLRPALQESGLIIMQFSSSDELFTKLFLENHLTTISEFYIDKKVERSYNLVALARKKRDSLLSVLTGKTYGLANMQDQRFGSVMRRAHVPEIQMNRDISIVTQQYTESVAALNAATLDMERKKPFISVVDDIRLPLDSTWPNPLKKAIGFSIFGLILGFAGIIGVLLGLDLLKIQRRDFEKNKVV